MSTPADLKYARSHEWVRVDGDVVTVGITDHAQSALGDVVHVELPRVGAHFGAGAEAAEIESVKAVSPIYAPIGGTVTAVNDEVADGPEVVNEDPYGKGWLFQLKADDLSQVADLLDAASYAATL
jgi:glycine cleavage system H protein